MSPHARRRVVSILLASLGLAALAGPAAGGTATTRYVDDDGTAGANGCSGAQVVPTSIQAAVDASSSGDTIRVCPGAYPESVNVDVQGLTIEGVKHWKAKVDPTSSTTDAIIQINADDVRIVWLRVVARTTGSCELFEAGIHVNSVDDASIIANHVYAATAGDALFGPCGMKNGIHVDDDGRALVRYNIVRDWRLRGVWIDTNDTGSAVKNNSIRFWHPDPCVLAVCTSRVGPAGGGSGVGVSVEGSTAVVSGNVISSAEGSILSAYIMSRGIRVADSSGVRVRGNTILRTFDHGIHLYFTSDSRVLANQLQTGAIGIALFFSENNRIRANRATGFSTTGIWMQSSAVSNTLTDNVATGNTLDCREDEDGGNTWTANTGATSDPAGLCTPV